MVDDQQPMTIPQPTGPCSANTGRNNIKPVFRLFQYSSMKFDLFFLKFWKSLWTLSLLLDKNGQIKSSSTSNDMIFDENDKTEKEEEFTSESSILSQLHMTRTPITSSSSSSGTESISCQQSEFIDTGIQLTSNMALTCTPSCTPVAIGPGGVIPPMIGINLEMYDGGNDNGYSYNSEDDTYSDSEDDNSSDDDSESDEEFPDTPPTFNYCGKGSDWKPKWKRSKELEINECKEDWRSWPGCSSLAESIYLPSDDDDNNNSNVNNKRSNVVITCHKALTGGSDNNSESESMTPTYNTRCYL